MATQPSYHPLATRVVYALKQVLHRGIPRLESRHYISMYELDPSHDKAILEFAKLDFNLLQSSYQKELKELTSSNATIEELELFNEAIQRWDISFANHLPDYMKLAYQFILDTFKEFERDLEKEGRSFCVRYAQEELKALSRAYLQEAKWFHKKYIPNYDEYFANAIVSSACTFVRVGSYLGMEEIAKREAFESIKTNPKATRAAGIIGRLMDDIGDHKFDKDRDYIVTAVKCYLKQYDVFEKVVHKELQRQIENAWMDLNEEILGPTIVPRPLLARSLNFCRAMDVIYKDLDGYTIVDEANKENIRAMLINPIQMLDVDDHGHSQA
ncbi:hypothetical protein Ancab_013470 [Ancistrocladus abbreviatus]